MNIGMNNVGYSQQQQYDVPTKLTNTDSHSNQYLSPQTSQTNSMKVVIFLSLL